MRLSQLMLLFVFVLTSSVSFAAISQHCFFDIASAISDPSSTVTVKFIALLKKAVEERFVSGDILQYLSAQESPMNPMIEDGFDRTRAHGFRAAFDQLLASDSDVDWLEVRAAIREIVDGEAKGEVRREKAAGETKFLPITKPYFVRKFPAGTDHASPVMIERNGQRIAVLGTWNGPHIVTLPGLKTVFSPPKGVEELGRTTMHTPLVYEDGGVWKILFSDNYNGFFMTELDHPEKFVKVNSKEMPSSDAAHFEWQGKQYAVFGNSGHEYTITLVNLTDNESWQIPPERRNVWMQTKPAVFFEKGVPYCLIGAHDGGPRLFNLAKREFVMEFPDVGESFSDPRLFERGGELFAFVVTKKRGFAVLNLTQRKVEKKIAAPAGASDFRASPALFKHGGGLYAAVGSGFRFYVVDIDNEKVITDLDLDQATYPNPTVVYSNGYPYVLQQTASKKYHVIDPFGGVILGTGDTTGHSEKEPLVFEENGVIYSLSGSSGGTELFQILGPPIMEGPR